MFATRVYILFILPLAASGLSFAPYPCEFFPCETGKVCRLVQVQCVQSPCFPTATCVPAPAPTGGCDFGEPVIDVSGKPITCSDCPYSPKCDAPLGPCCWTIPVIDPCFPQGFQVCPVGTTCKSSLVDPECVGNYCDKTKECIVDNQDPCEDFECEKGFRCETVLPPCANPIDIFPPPLCLPQPVCVEIPTNPGTCPPVRPGEISICPVQCKDDGECDRNLKCCPNACGGNVCTVPISEPEPIPYPCDLALCPEDNPYCRVKQPDCDEGPCPLETVCLPTRKCPVGFPLRGPGGVEIYCGRGGEECPSGHQCITDPGDRWAVCCPNAEPKCPKGSREPILDANNEELVCGNRPNSVTCPFSAFCALDSGACCFRTELQEFNPCIVTTCLRGTVCEARAPANCQQLPCTLIAVCVPSEEDPCKDANCPPGFSCQLENDEECTGPSACSLVAKCVRDSVKPGTCPEPTGPGPCFDACSRDGDCTGNQKCCSNGCGRDCQSPEGTTGPIPYPCIFARCSLDTECRIQTACEDGVCFTGPSCIPKRCQNGFPAMDSNNVELTCDKSTRCLLGYTCETSSVGNACCPNPGTPVLKKCLVGDPVVNRLYQELRCGEGPNTVTCPKGTYCYNSYCCHQPNPPPRCSNGDPAVDPRTGRQIFCGKGSDRQDCPPDFSCSVDPTDKSAVCCPDSNPNPTCPTGAPAEDPTTGKQIFCGRGDGRQECPPGYSCNIDPVDRFAVCCLKTNQFPTCPIGTPAVDPKTGRRIDCGGGSGRQDCPEGFGCNVFPDVLTGTITSICCLEDPCALVDCEDGRKCKVVTNPCLIPPCPVEAECIETNKNGKCPTLPPGATTACAFPPPPSCEDDSECQGMDKCCDIGCGPTCSKPLVSFVPSDPCYSKTCDPNQVCRLERRCRGKRCYVVPTCQDRSTVANSKLCKSGYPVIDRRGKLQTCPKCPENTVCDDDVCCWNADSPTPTTPPSVPACPNNRFLYTLICFLFQECDYSTPCNAGSYCCRLGLWCGARCIS